MRIEGPIKLTNYIHHGKVECVKNFESKRWSLLVEDTKFKNVAIGQISWSIDSLASFGLYLVYFIRHQSARWIRRYVVWW